MYGLIDFKCGLLFEGIWTPLRHPAPAHGLHITVVLHHGLLPF